MAIYNIPDQVVSNIQLLIARCPIKGAEAPAILEIQKVLSSPVNPHISTGKEDAPPPLDPASSNAQPN